MFWVDDSGLSDQDLLKRIVLIFVCGKVVEGCR